MSPASRSPEMRADRAPGRQRLGHASGDIDDHIVAHVHAEGFVDDMQAVYVEIQNDVRIRGTRRREQRRGLAFECLAGHQAGAGIVLRLNDAGRSFRQHFGDARLMQVEVLRARRIEQGEHAHDALRRVPYGAGQNLVRSRDVARDLGNMIDDDGALLQLHPGHQMMLRPVQRFRRHRLSAARQGQADVLVRHPQSGERAAHALQPGLQDEPEFVGVAGGGRLMRGNFQHQIQVALAHVEIAFAGTQFGAQRELAPSGTPAPAAPTGARSAAGAARFACRTGARSG